MGYHDFWEMTPRELGSACKGYNERVNREYRTGWEQTRWLGTIQANTFSKKRIQPYDLLKLPWETEVIDRSKEIELIKERRKWLQ